ncbi:hypothetical protein ACV34Z_35325, partial [Pseudomonas aeruginosa]
NIACNAPRPNNIRRTTMTATAPAQASLDDLLARIVRDDVRAMGAYHVPDATGMVKLDAMENPYPLPAMLRDALGKRLA